MELKKLKAAIEAVLFANAEPLPAARIAAILEIEPSLAEKLLLSLRDEYEKEDHGIQLITLEDAWQFTTKQQYSAEVKLALDNRRNTPLSAAALEVLAIIAYNQPISRSFIEQVRGVDSSSTVMGLVEKGLVAEAGRLDLPGRPIAYRTTDAFLRAFGITSLHELPPLHQENTPEDESQMFAQPAGEQLLEADEMQHTQALRGGTFIEGEAGAAENLGELE